MVKKIIILVMALSLLGTMGCTIASPTTTTASATVKTIREAKIGTDWAVKQMEITLGEEMPIVLKLATGDDVDGYFYLVKGTNVDFTVAGKSQIYESEAADTKNPRITSDRFSFSATGSQGVAYTLNFSNPTADDDTPEKLTVFVEIVYPATGSIYIPIEAE